MLLGKSVVVSNKITLSSKNVIKGCSFEFAFHTKLVVYENRGLYIFNNLFTTFQYDF